MRPFHCRMVARAGVVTLVLAIAAASAHGQATGVVRGVVQDSANRPLEANVIVEGPRSSEALPPGSAFRVVVASGAVRLHVRMVGYFPLDTSISVGQGEEARVALVLARVPRELDTLRVFARGCDPHRFQGFQCRRASGTGTFLDQAAIDSAHQTFIGGLFDDVPGFRVGLAKHNLIPVPTTGWRCIVHLVDGLPQRWDGVSWYPAIPQSPSDILALEIYAAAKDVPSEYQQFTWKGGQRCSVIVYWTSGRVRKVR